MPHTSHQVIEDRIKNFENQITVGGEYCHWKNLSTKYMVDGLGTLEWDDTMLVVMYHPVNADYNITWIRRVEGEDGWLTPVDERPGEDKRRFIPVDELENKS